MLARTGELFLGKLIFASGQFRLASRQFVGFKIGLGFAFGESGFAFGEFAGAGFGLFDSFQFDGLSERDKLVAFTLDCIPFFGDANGLQFALKLDAALAFPFGFLLQLGNSFARDAVARNHAEDDGGNCGGDGVLVNHGKCGFAM